MGYAITLILMLAVYSFGIWGLRYIKKERLFTVLFPFLIFLAYLYCVNHIAGQVGTKDWNFTNALPTANVSPFMYCLTPFIFLFSKKVQKYLYTLVSLLSFGLLCAGGITCVFNIARNYKFHFNIALDSVLHGALSFYGVYLVKSGRSVLDRKTCLISGGIMVSVAATMLGLNLALHTSFFGLSLYGNHNIYNFVISESGYISAGIYFLGLGAVLCMGALYQRILSRRKK